MARKHSLHTFVHRTLVYRLIIVGLILSFIIGLIALLLERDRLSLEAIDIAVSRLSVFVDHYEHLLANPDNLDSERIHQAIIEFQSTRSKHKLGSFVHVSVYDTQEKIITEAFAEKYEKISAVRKKQQELKIKIPSEGSDQYEVIRIAGIPHLRIALPLVNSNQKNVGFINVFFAFSDATIEAARGRGIRAMIFSIAIVLLTTAILYPVILRLNRRITEFSVHLLNANIDTLETLGSAIAQRDSDTNAHNYRVSIYATRIGEEVGLSNQTMRTLIKGSFLHDVGKIGIPDEILLKPGRLDDKEFSIMKSHVEQGREIIERSRWLQDAKEVVLSHHEKLAGAGYPMGLTGDKIPVTARIFAIADVFDALTSKRPYKEAWPFEKAMEAMEEGRGTHFDADILDAFSDIARPLYDKFGGKEEIFREDLAEIISKYFHEGMDSLEY
jgi:HD-GYP domain-containing protein (c-di-GMP phosphodiesterase class II)